MENRLGPEVGRRRTRAKSEILARMVRWTSRMQMMVVGTEAVTVNMEVNGFETNFGNRINSVC